jgi:hypothetical protein
MTSDLPQIDFSVLQVDVMMLAVNIYKVCRVEIRKKRKFFEILSKLHN